MSRRRRAGAASMMASGRSERTAELVKLSTVAGANYARKTVGSAFASDERKAELQARYELQTAEQVAEVLGNMKGAVMKLGQMASYLDGGLPEPVRQALAQMQQDAPPMSYELVAGVVRAELGGEPDTVFASFEREPMASASIGQVHRAVTHDGRAVAVKVQYPGVDAAIRADLDNSDLLFGAMGMLFSGLDPAPLVAELRDRLLEELDYRNEAANQQRFVDYFAGHPTISVPEVLHELSTGRVLCTELAYGAKWTDVLEWSQEERNLTAETLYRFAFGGIYRLGVFNGDPHPGNYLFRPGGEVTFLDFGLCKVFTPDEIAEFQRLITAMVLHQDPVEVRRVWSEAGVLVDDPKLSDELIHEYFSHFFEMVLKDETMAITSEYASDSLRRFFDLSGPYGEVMKSVTLPSFMVVIQRINLGLYALFGELRAVANWRRLAEEVWPFVDRDPTTPMGEASRRWEIERGYRSAE
ncbi:MAG TPA: AarF/ABC1/UbiB kinase family protein [Microthrixaceae bacterium]|nr:AarF/ABC1/UbiB kinase family protein [Microthrixaceae bacterium]